MVFWRGESILLKGKQRTQTPFLSPNLSRKQLLLINHVSNNKRVKSPYNSNFKRLRDGAFSIKKLSTEKVKKYANDTKKVVDNFAIL